MKNRLFPIILLFVILVVACEDERVDATFEDVIEQSICDYITDNEEFSSFLRLLKSESLTGTLQAYNPDGDGYTLFLPDNEAVSAYIEQSDYSSLEELLNDDSDFRRQLCLYHIVNTSISSDDFPIGALSDYTLNDDYLTVSVVSVTDSSYYLINGEAAVTDADIEVANGYVHLINYMLDPITFTTYEWLEDHSGYSIFKNAVDLTGLEETFSFNSKDEDAEGSELTLLLEHDSVFNAADIYSLDDLIELVSPDDDDYTNTSGSMYNFVAYHLLAESAFLDDFYDVTTNYVTYSDIPLRINGEGTEIKINSGKTNFDTIVDSGDTTIIDYITFDYEESNVVTQSGVIHFIDQVMQQVTPSTATQTFEFFEENLLNEYREEAATYLIDDTSFLDRISWSGADLYFILSDDESHSAWNQDYLYIDGDFTISYTVPEIVQGEYSVYIHADAYDSDNAMIEVKIDGSQIGSFIDLSTGGSADSPFTAFELGTINFLKYEEHTIEITPLIPGAFSWDYIQFVP